MTHESSSQKTSGQRTIFAWIRGVKLHTKILIGLILGAVLGPLMGEWAIRIKPVGDAFINLLIMVVVPLVMASLIVGTASLGDLRKLGRIGIKTVGYYVVATALAVALGLAAGKVFNPGAGMDEETMKRALLPFYSTKKTGSGLGLALCREIAEGHDGRIGLQQRPGGGTIVSCWFPDWVPGD